MIAVECFALDTHAGVWQTPAVFTRRDAIAKLIRESGLSYDAIAIATSPDRRSPKGGVNKGTLSRYLKGHTARLQPGTEARVLAAIGKTEADVAALLSVAQPSGAPAIDSGGANIDLRHPTPPTTLSGNTPAPRVAQVPESEEAVPERLQLLFRMATAFAQARPNRLDELISRWEVDLGSLMTDQASAPKARRHSRARR